MNLITSILGETLTQRYGELRSLLDRGIQLAEECDAPQDTRDALRDRHRKLDSAALFVIVGEVKSGKSSFINALFGQQVCEVDAKPCTATIQELAYGSESQTIQLGEKWERLLMPHDVLRAITIVDTPGTNSIMRGHQVVTERYIPQCDVAVFVFPAKNPHTETAWKLLEHIRKDWLHRVVFVLQQSDLASKTEMDTNLDSVRQYARERGITDPRIFAVSALREQQGAADSGYAEFRKFLRDSIESGEVWQIKFEGGCNVLLQTTASILSTLHQGEAALWQDIRLVEDIEILMSERKAKLSGLHLLVIDSLLKTYDGLTSGLQSQIREGLDVGTVLRRSLPIIRDTTMKDWLAKVQSTFEAKVRETVAEKARGASAQLEAEINSLIDEMESRIQSHQHKVDGLPPNLVAGREETLASLREAVSRDKLTQHLENNLPSEVALEGGLLGGGGLILIGTLVAIFTKVAILDITGGVLATLGAAVIAATLLWKRGAILKDLEAGIARGRKEFEKRLTDHLESVSSTLFHEIGHHLATTQSRFRKKLEDLKPRIERATAIESEIRSLRGE